MNISSYKLARLHSRRPGHGYEMETSKEKLNLKIMQLEQIISKLKLIIHNRQASVGYVETNITLNPIWNKFSKQAQKECMTTHDWVGKAINWELGKRLKFDHTTKWYLCTFSFLSRIVNWVTMTRKSNEHLRATYGNNGQLFRPY